ncbi:hypothetical protein [Kiloniella sp.]|uniref:hypothetical protein n=1 Tax=Kiloniella sp. TaxID=1938587 RepID=UPI003B01397C
MNEPAHVISKLEKEVEIVLNTGEKLSGIFYAKQYERVSDLLNDARTFLPFKDTNDVMRIIAKETIFQVIPREHNEPQSEQKKYIYPNRL